MATAIAEPLLDADEAESRAVEAEARARRRFAPPPDLTLREWTQRHRRLSQKNSPEPGPLRLDRTPHLREIMDAYSDPRVEEMTAMKCTQSGATDALILSVIGYHIHQDPGPGMVIIPSVDEAEKWSKKKLAPMLAETKVLRGLVADPRSRTGDNTILEKETPGGSLGIVGSNSGRGFRMVTCRYAIGDDVDGWDESAGTEGDQITLTRRRTDRFPDRKLLWVSTPTTEPTERDPGSRIARLYRSMDRRGRFCVPCAHCGHYQYLRWGRAEDPFGIKWDKDVTCKDCGANRGDEEECEACGARARVVEHHPETAAYLCEHCGVLIEERYKTQMALAGTYRTEEGEELGRAKSLGFQYNALTMLLAGSEWPKLVEEWLKVKDDPDALKGFVNTVLAETWREATEKVDPTDLESRGEAYPAEVPAGVGVLTAGVDVQRDRLEVVVRGWGAGEQSWLILHERIYGDPERTNVWAQLENILAKGYEHEEGAQITIGACCIDSGDGETTAAVYKFVRPRQGRRVYATKGTDSRQSELLKRGRSNKYGVKLWTINTIRFKDMLFRRLRIAQPGPGYMHFCMPTTHGADAEYYAQFGAEEAAVRTIRGRRSKTYIQTRDRNEAIDLEVLALVALHTLGPSKLARLATEVERMKEEGRKAREARDAPGGTESIAPARSRRRGSYVHGWKP